MRDKESCNIKQYEKRPAFSLLTSIFVILILSTVSVYIFSLSGKIANETAIEYRNEEAALLARSYTEYAIMAVSANDRNGSGQCIENIYADIGNPVNGKGYRVEVKIAYIGTNEEISNCSSEKKLGIVHTKKMPLNIIIDVTVRYREQNHPHMSDKPESVPWIQYHRRSLQKI